jgi:hypothetical protein
MVRAALLHEASQPEPGLVAAQPLLDLAYTLYNAVVAPLGALRKPKAW